MLITYRDGVKLAGITNMPITESGFKKISTGWGTGTQKFPRNKVLHLGPSNQLPRSVLSKKGLQSGLNKKSDFRFSAQFKKRGVIWLKKAKCNLECVHYEE